MNTVILKWNPAISSYNMIRFLQNIVREDNEGNWSIWEYDRVHKGDRFFMLKVGNGATGIVSYGRLTSDPYVSADWSGQGRKVYYCDLYHDIMISPATFSILSSEQLEDAMPDFDWHKGHSGAVLSPEQAAVFGKLWQAYLLENVAEFRSRLELIDGRGLWNDQLFVSQKFRKEIAL